MATEERLRWSDVFIRRAANVFKVRSPYHERVLDCRPVEEFAAGVFEQSYMMAGDSAQWVFLDGGVSMVNQEWPETFDTSTFGDGVWVVGTSALRAICDALDIVPPRRLGAESQVPAIESIHADLAAHRTVLESPHQARLMQDFGGAQGLLSHAAAGGH